MNNTINLQLLASELASATGSSPELCEVYLKNLISEISNRLINEGQCTVPHIGTFTADCDAGDVVFIPNEVLAAAVNEPFSFFEPVELAVEESQLLSDEASESISHEEEPQEESLPHEKEVEDAVSESTAPSPEEAATEEMVQLEQITTPQAETEISEEYNEEPVSVDEPDEPEVTEEPEVEVVVETRAWPVIVGVLAGLVTGIIIGMLLYSHVFSNYREGNAAQKTTSTPADTVAVYIIDNPKVSDTVGQKAEKPEVMNTSTVVRDTVTTHNFLATMARKYYGVMEYWVFIYEENRDILPANPNRIKPGTIVVIPDIEKYVNPADKAEAKAEAQRRISRLEQSMH